MIVPALKHIANASNGHGIIFQLNPIGLFLFLIMLINHLYSFFSSYVIDFHISYPSSMNERNIIRRFDFLNSRSPSKIESHKKIQEFLYYAESRFWAILNFITRAPSNRNDWCQKLLHRELVRI